MKKFFCITVFSLLCLFFLSAQNSPSSVQNSASSANKNTALRCLKLAENCLVAQDWDNAIKQAELGLSYDESISDLLYVKAAAQMNTGSTRAEVLKIINLAFEKNNWTSYTRNGARILLADLLCDTGDYEKSLEILDSEPLIYSADAEFIRVKNFYRMGSVQTINNARLKLNSARRIYPSDVRFPELFFLFEAMFLNEAKKSGIEYAVPEIVRTIAAAYISKFPDYSGQHTQMELLASFFADDAQKNRLVRAIDAKNQTFNPVLAIAGLNVGLYTEAQAFELFFNTSENTVSLSLLETLVSAITDTDVQQKVIEKLVNFSGTICIDENLDLQNEISIEYELGRPQYIRYDRNNDGVIDLYASCDLGAPLFVFFNDNKSEVFYEGFPKVSKVSFVTENYTFNFQHDDLTFSPFEFVQNNVFARLGIEFYMPNINKDIAVPQPEDMVRLSSSVELPVEERDDGKVIFTSEEGHLLFANFFENERKYAYCDFTTGLPYIRYVDYDNDGYYETTELYDLYDEENNGFDKDKESSYIEKIFTKAFASENLFLKKVQIDRNGNTFCEFCEQYMENNGKVTLWDNDDNGIWDCQYIRYPQKEGESLVEETIYFGSNGLPVLSLNLIDSVPVKMISNNQEVMVYAGLAPELFWIEAKGTAESEKVVLDFVKKELVQGAIEVIQNGEERISVIKVGKKYFCRILPPFEEESELEE